MDEKTLCNLSIRGLGGLLRKGEISSAEVTRQMLNRIRRLNPSHRAYITVLEDSALGAAAQADKEIATAKPRGPLHGIPVAVKDLCFTKGVRTTCSSSVLRDWQPDSTATVVTRLENAGAVILGKLNLTEFAVAWYSREFPPPLNPWNPRLWPGGSSSGSGVATAAGLCFGSIGTDTGGSIRFPTASCGIVGLKPTWGRVSRHGVFPLGESLDHVGPMTRYVADAALMLATIAGHDPSDQTSLAAPVDDYAASLGKDIKGIRIGVDEKFIRTASAEVNAPVLDAVRTLEGLGATIVNVEMPDTAPALAAWTTLCASETLAAHAEFYPARAAEYGDGFRSFLKLGTKITGADYANAHMVRERFSNRFQELFDEVDVIACPSMPVQSLPADALAPDAEAFSTPNPLLIFTAPFNLSRNPTLSLPCGTAAGGPPPSLQLVSRRLGEATLIQVGDAYERATEWHRQHPDCG
jgi:amidase